MRKNKMMRAASGLLVAVLLTTCIISGTFAKYVTEDSGADTARVAKFGVTIDAKGTTFAKEYKTDAGNVVGTIAKSVISNDKVVAPGTKGELVNATISGIPEVAVNVKYEPTLTLTGWNYNNDEYCPIVFTVNGQTFGINGIKTSSNQDPTVKCNDIADLKAKVEAAIGNYTKNYDPNTDLSKIDENADKGYVHVSWEWAYDTNEDIKDTYLGDQAAKGEAATVSLSIKTTVTQID